MQRWGLRCRWELSPIGDSKRAFKIIICSKFSLDFWPLWSRFWKFWADNLTSRLQLDHVPVHETHGAEFRKIITKSKTPSLNRIASHKSSLPLAKSRGSLEGAPEPGFKGISRVALLRGSEFRIKGVQKKITATLTDRGTYFE